MRGGPLDDGTDLLDGLGPGIATATGDGGLYEVCHGFFMLIIDVDVDGLPYAAALNVRFPDRSSWRISNEELRCFGRNSFGPHFGQPPAPR